MRIKIQHLVLSAILVALAAFHTQCAIGPNHGVLFTQTKFAGDINPANDVVSAKTGEACMHYVLNIVALGQAGAGDAAQAGGIKRIATIDHSAFSVLSFYGIAPYAQYCTIVAGE